MVIKNDKVRLGLWKLRFQDGLSPKECVDRLTDAKVSCKTQIYETLREFDGAVSWQYTKRGRKRSERVCAGGLTAGELKCLKVLIDEDPNRQYWQLQEMMVHKLNVRLSTTQIGIAVNTGVKEHGLGYSHKLKQFVAGEKDHESRVAFLKYISLLLPAWDENWHKVVFFDEMHGSLREGCKKKQLGPKGVPACAVERFGPEARQTFTLSAAVNTSGVIEGTPGIYEAGVDTDTFYLSVVFHLCPTLGNYANGEANSIVFCGVIHTLAHNCS